jgi:hypothetical protein
VYNFVSIHMPLMRPELLLPSRVGSTVYGIDRPRS